MFFGAILMCIGGLTEDERNSDTCIAYTSDPFTTEEMCRKMINDVQESEEFLLTLYALDMEVVISKCYAIEKTL